MGAICGEREWPAPIATRCYTLPWGGAFYSRYPEVSRRRLQGALGCIRGNCSSAFVTRSDGDWRDVFSPARSVFRVGSLAGPNNLPLRRA